MSVNDTIKKATGIDITKETVLQETVPTNIPALDKILGGGIAKDKLVLLAGKEQSCKTTLALQICRQFLALDDRSVLYADAEQTLNPNYTHDLDDNDRFTATQELYKAEDVMMAVRDLARSGEVSLVVVDAISALPVMAELDDLTGRHVGVTARAFNTFFKSIVGELRQHKTTLVCINHWHENIGVMYGDSRFLPGGKAQRTKATQLISMSGKKRKENDGLDLTATTIKNKVSRPNQKADFTFLFEEGFNGPTATLDAAIEAGTIKRKGAYYVLDEETKFLGKKKLKEAYVNGELAQWLK